MQHFSGAHVTRRGINLGGAQRHADSSPAGLAERARVERQGRERQRVEDRAAVRIQGFWRGRRAAYEARNQWRGKFDQIASRGAQGLSIDDSFELSLLLVHFLVDRNAGDLKRAASWARLIFGPPINSPAKQPALFAQYSTPAAQTWQTIIRKLAHTLLVQAVVHPSIPQAPLFLEIVKMLVDPASYAKWGVKQPTGSTVADYLVARNLHGAVRRLITAIPPTLKTHPTLPAAIALALLPFKAYPAPPPPQTATAKPTAPSPQRLTVLNAFTFSILTIPLLPNRVPLPALTALAGLPLDEILAHLASPAGEAGLSALAPEASAHLLANLLAFGSKRVPTFASGRVLAGYLGVLNVLLNKLPKEALVPRTEEAVADVKGKGREVVDLTGSDEEADENDGGAVQEARRRVGTAATDGDGDVKMESLAAPVSPRLTLDRRTINWLNTLVARDHLTAILNSSSKFSASSRPALAAFLVSVLSTFTSHRDSVLSTVMYNGASSSGTAERGGGLLRELYRGYVRASGAGRLLGSAQRGAAILAGLGDARLAGDWPALIVLAELYARCLLTLGDDEFHSARNPLSLDEVVGLSGQLRNLAFTLYWMEDSLETQDGRPRLVAGTRVGYEGLRSLATGLLQQIYARDSRRPFTPEGHWLMTDQFDLSSFSQTVIYEDQQLDAGEDATAPERSIWDDGLEEEPARRGSKANLTKRQMSFISPRLGVLNNIPFVLPFENRVQIFRQFVDNDRKRLGIQRDRFTRGKRHQAIIRRNHLSEDAYASLNGLGAGLKGSVEIVFKDEHGFEESGIDGGGLFKELLTSLSKEVFDTDRGLWLSTAQHELYPNPHAYARGDDSLSWYQFIGRILGKALYEGILVEVRFAAFFLAKWLGRQSYLDDLASLDAELYKGLVALKDYQGNVEDLSLNFTVTEDEFGVSREVPLVPGGADVAVTNENRMRYILLTSHYKLNTSSARQCEAFFRGLSEIVPERFLRLFNQQELRVLVGGAEQEIDVDDLKANTYYGGWDESHDTVRAFWRVVSSFSPEHKSALVKFVTSVPRPPLLGFVELNPRFAIRDGGADEARLPTSSTCVNLLKLPQYRDEHTLRRKLVQAITSGAGFDLS